MLRHTISVTSQDQEEVVGSKMWDQYPDSTELRGDSVVDVVNKPPHYNTGEIECIEYLKDNLPEQAFIGYLEGNTKKYLHRWRYKGKASQDLEKAKWYLSYLQLEVAKGETK